MLDMMEAVIEGRKLKPRPLSLLTISDGHYDRLSRDADLITFDVFDTLIHRQTVLPTDVFMIVERRLRIKGFGEQRRLAEARARRLSGERSSEVSLEEIYEAFPVGFLDNPAEAMAAELIAEQEVTYPNGAMQLLIKRLRAECKRTVAISDIYLSSGQVTDLLRSNGIEVDAVYTSADHRHTDSGKYNGRLYSEVQGRETVAMDRILHVGDHARSDVANMLALGGVAVQSDHPVPYLSGRSDHFSVVMDEHNTFSSRLVVGTIARDKVNDASRLANSIETYGYDFGGALVVGFVLHVLKRCREQGINHLVLLARDGCVIGDVLDVLKPEGFTWRVMPCSRRLAVFPAYAAGGFDKIKSLFAGNDRLSKRAILSILKLEHLADGLSDLDTVLPVHVAVEQMRLILLEQAKAEGSAMRECLAAELAMLDKGKTFAWVDVGWALSSPMRLNELLGHDIPGFFVGSHGNACPAPHFHGYLFERGRPKALTRIIMRSVELLELVFADTQPSSAWMKSTSDGLQTIPYAKAGAEKVRDMHIDAVRAGVVAFTRDIAPLADLLDPEELRDYNRVLWKRICQDPPKEVYRYLSVIPHDAVAGTLQWNTIGDLWLPNFRFDKPDRKTFATAGAFRKAYVKRWIKWNLPAPVYRAASQVQAMLQRYI